MQSQKRKPKKSVKPSRYVTIPGTIFQWVKKMEKAKKETEENVKPNDEDNDNDDDEVFYSVNSEIWKC